VTPGDEVHEHPEVRQEDDEHEPEDLGEAARSSLRKTSITTLKSRNSHTIHTKKNIIVRNAPSTG
jgi:hypothetical protein